MERKIIVLVAVVALVCACTGQGVLPPMPTDVIAIDAELEIESQNPDTGDVAILYTLYIKNVGDQSLQKVILKDFDTPDEVVMEKDYFELSNLGPGQQKSITFRVVVEGWGQNPRDETWDVDFTIRIEEDSAYTEEEAFYYQIHLYPQ